ncbi:MAG: hypothetical protein SFY92_06590 [Verrucomicrobiae bacterium]|nr:hypothetical protein [Verrucomicrobiae bacterium]
MRKEINWVTRSAEGVRCEVRVNRFAGKITFQYREKGAPDWDHSRTPSLEDWEELLDCLERRYARKQARDEEIEEVRLMIASLKNP